MATKIIALDAGHGLRTAGKQTPDGIKEWTLNDKVRDKVVAMLNGYDVAFIFPDNNEGNVDEGLSERRTMYLNKKVDVAVSIHHNAYTGDWNNATGVEVYVDRNATAADRRLAECIYPRLVANTGMKARGIKEANWAVINQNSIPAVLTEGGFMDNKKDYAIITSDAGQTAYAKAIADGLIEFLGLTKAAPKPAEPAEERNYLMKGDEGAEVKEMQEDLIKLGYSCGEYGADGDFGNDTDAAVRAFQKANGLVIDGLYGEKSKAKVKELLAKALDTKFPAVPFMVRVLIDDLNIRTAPSMDGKVTGVTKKGSFTIVEVRKGWGKLKSGAGWIYLENPNYCTVVK